MTIPLEIILGILENKKSNNFQKSNTDEYCQFGNNEWSALSMNQNISLEFIRKNIDKPWDWYNLTINNSITMEFIEEYPDKPWDYTHLIYNQNLTYEFFIEYLNKIDVSNLDIVELVNHPNFSTDNIIDLFTNVGDLGNFMTLENKLSHLSYRRDISINYVRNNLNIGWFWDILSSNIGIKMEDIINNPDNSWGSDLPKWDYTAISYNPNLTLSFISDNLDKPWDFSYLFNNPIITEELKNMHPELFEQDVNIQFYNDGIIYTKVTIDEIKNDPDKYDWGQLSVKSNVTLTEISENADLPWKWLFVLLRPELFPVSYCIYKYNKTYNHNIGYYYRRKNILDEYESSVKNTLDLYLCDDLIFEIIKFI